MNTQSKYGHESLKQMAIIHDDYFVRIWTLEHLLSSTQPEEKNINCHFFLFFLHFLTIAKCIKHLVGALSTHQLSNSSFTEPPRAFFPLSSTEGENESTTICTGLFVR